LREECNPNEQHADVALVLDASSSMGQDYSPGATRWDAAVDAATAFVELLRDGDQSAVVWFNSQARVEQELTGNRQALYWALQRITLSELTRLSLGLKVAQEELASPRHLEFNSSAIVLLTDGKANPEPVSDALAAAEAAKLSGTTVFVVGLGEPEALDDQALRMMASRPEYYYQTPNAEDLSRIYEEIGGVIPCPVGQYWGRR
jgi:Mg-chelatase subunit ChlD